MSEQATNPNKNDEVSSTITVYRTKDYAQFRLMTGNREVDKIHVNYLKAKIQREGNLMAEFPADVNEHRFIVDGQHRLKAAEELGDWFYYTIKPHTNIDTVIALNSGNRNWTWLDYAASWSARGNRHYTELIRLHDEYNQRFNILMRYCGFGSNHHATGEKSVADLYRTGQFEIKDLSLTRKLLEQYDELNSVAKNTMREFALAAYSFMRTPEYVQQTMVDKIRAFGDGLNRCYTVADFLIEFENIYKA